MTLPAPLAPFLSYRQFITYRLQPRPGKPGKMDKIPCDWQTGEPCDHTDVRFHTNYATAMANTFRADIGHGCGVGFSFGEHDPFWFLDLDHALVDGQWSANTIAIYQALPGAAWEISQSGTGLHAYGTGSYPDNLMTRNNVYGIELYHKGRFVALTGTMWGDVGCASNHVPQIADVAAAYLPLRPVTAPGEEWTSEPDEGYDSRLLDDDYLLKCMLKPQPSDLLPPPIGQHASKFTLKQLWEGAGLGSDQESELDQSLANHLMFWTGRDCERTERLMRMSSRMRPKWDDHHTYLREFTITNARRVCLKIARPREVTASPVVYQRPVATHTIAGPDVRPSYITGTNIAEYFAGCVYVADRDAIFAPEGIFLKKSAFDGVYGAPSFALDAQSEKMTESAWEAFRLNKYWLAPRAHSTCFRPECDQGAVLLIEGLAYLNCYVPIQVECVEGDASPFVNHVHRMLPNGQDAELLLHYMASVVQHPGAKFQWWPLVQGVKGNGKTLLLTAMVAAIGSRYSHLVNPEAMVKTGNQFNSWIENKLFVGFEEVRTSEKRDMAEALKTTVTNRRIGSEAKGRDQTTADNRANGLLLSNHKDSLVIEKDERRFGVFYCAQQTEQDLIRDGMGGLYFPTLYEWFDNGGGAIVAHYLANKTLIAELDPAQHVHRAPQTSSTSEAITESYGAWEQEVLEAIDEGRQGFCGGLVSSSAVTRLFAARRITMAPRKVRTLMKSLGYEWHPALIDGRVNNPLGSEGKPRMYAKRGSAAWDLTTCADVVGAYSAAQSVEPPAPSNVVQFAR